MSDPGSPPLQGLEEDVVLRTLVEGTAGETGERFFAALVQSLARALNTQDAWVTEYLEESRRLRALAFWMNGAWIHDFAYDVAGTPCEPALDSPQLVHFPQNVVALFPDDPYLETFRAVSYMGVRLTDTDGRSPRGPRHPPDARRAARPCDLPDLRGPSGRRAAIVLTTLAERRFAEQARASVASAEACLGHATPRERARVRAARRLGEGDWDGACAALDRVLVDHPRDAFTIQSAHLMDFFRGDSLNLRNRISRVLPHWSPSVPGYSYVLGMHAFGLEECNQYPEAEETARRALALQPRDAWAVHAGAHVMEMQGRIDEGIAWLESREPDWAPDNGFAFHNYRHLALYRLDRQRYADALALYDARVHPRPPEFALQLLDATALLWRLHLEGLAVAGRAAVLADNWAGRLETERGVYAFNDMHAMMAFTMADRDAEAARLRADLEWAARNATGVNRTMTRDVGLPVCLAIQAFGRARYAEVIERLEPIRDVAVRFGGSHAQRDVLTLTLIEAAIRSGRWALAQHYIAERIVHKPAGGWGWRLLGRTAARAGAEAGTRP